MYLERNKTVILDLKEYQNTEYILADIIIPRSGATLLVRNICIKNFDEKFIYGYILIDNGNKMYVKYPISYIIRIVFRNLETNKNKTTLSYKEYSKYDFKKSDDLKNKSKNNILDETHKPKNYKTKNLNDKIYKVEEKIKAIIPDINLDNCLYCMQPASKCLVKCIEIKSKNKILKIALKYIKIKKKEKKIFYKMKKLRNMLIFPFHKNSLKLKVSILESLEYMYKENITEKGKVASQLTIGDELVIADVFSNMFFKKLNSTDMLKVIACFALENYSGSTISKNDELLYRLIECSVFKITEYMKSIGIEISYLTYIKKFASKMITVIILWIKGNSLTDISNITGIPEKSIINAFKKIENITKQILYIAINLKNDHLIDTLNEILSIIQKKNFLIYYG